MLNSLPNPSDCENEHIASVFLALIITSSVWLTIDADAREIVFSWIREVYENSIIYRFWDQDETGVLPHYDPTWLPEGFEQVYEYRDEISHGRLYQKQNSKSGIVIEYYIDVGSIHTELIAKNAENLREEVFINGIKVDFYNAAEGLKQIAAKKIKILIKCPETPSSSVYYYEKQIEKDGFFYLD